MNEMLSTPSVSLAGILLTLLLDAVLVACEFSLLKIRFSHFNTELRNRVEADRRLAPLLEAGDRSHRVIRLAHAGCLLLYALFSLPLFFALVALPGREVGGFGRALAAALAFLAALTLQQAVGELLPRALGLAHPLGSLRLGQPLIVLFGWLTRPIRRLALGMVRCIWRLWRKEPMPSLDVLDLETQVDRLRKESPEMSLVAQLILKNALLMRELVVSDVLLPRNQVKYFDLNQPLEANLQMAKASGHTRFPLCYGDLDHCIGLIHIKDLFRYPGDLAQLDLRRIKRSMIRIESEEPLESALTKLLAHRMHMALVIDEFHGTKGVLTLERVLEQLVGDIRDEFDAEEEALIKSDEQAHEVVVSGLTPLHEIASLFGVEMESNEVSTIGGLITSELGRIPEAGERLSIAGLEIAITRVDETRVLELTIRRPGPGAPKCPNSSAPARPESPQGAPAGPSDPA